MKRLTLGVKERDELNTERPDCVLKGAYNSPPLDISQKHLSNSISVLVLAMDVVSIASDDPRTSLNALVERPPF